MGIFDTAWLAATVLAATPLVLAAVGELVSERAGVLNVGLEGMMIAGAFFGFVAAAESGNWLIGAGAGVAAGVAVGALAAVLSVWARADQIVVGIALNIFMLSLTAFLFSEMYSGGSRSVVGRPSRIAVPVLSSIPGIGPALFEHQLFVYVAACCVPIAWLTLFKTGWGLSVRASGENPGAADSAGLRVGSLRTLAALIAGGAAGLGGAFLSVGQVGAFTQNMTAGRGFLALAAVIFGRWRPMGVLGTCVIFGAADALQFRLQARGEVPGEVWTVAAAVAVAIAFKLSRARRPPGDRTAARLMTGLGLLGVAAAAMTLAATGASVSLPTQLWLALPYVMTLILLGAFVGRARMPTALGIPYVRGST